MSPTDADATTGLLAELTARLDDAFSTRHARRPRWITAAPGRVNLIGEHVDYNDGFVLPMAIDRYVVIAAAPLEKPSRRQAKFYSVDLQDEITIPLDETLQPENNGWGTYVAGVVASFLEAGTTIPSFEAVIQSNVPLGGGLSSSAALEVATATLLETVTGIPLAPAEKALRCQQAEHRFAGVPCGIMDQFSSVFGAANELMLLDCQSQRIQPVPFAGNDVTVLITNSNVQHELSGGEYAQRRAECTAALEKLDRSSWRDITQEQLESQRQALTSAEYHRARHVIGEIARTTAAANAIQEQDWDRVGELMYASHVSLRDDYEVSCAELDTLVELADQLGRPGGVFGSRMTGGGFGGCTVSLVSTDKAAEIANWLESQYEQRTGVKPQSFASRPARGSHVVRE